jgi:hypothetical protein
MQVGMRTLVVALMAIFAYASAAVAQTRIACSCEAANTVCLTDVEMSMHVIHVEMEPDRMGNHSNYSGVGVFKIGFDEEGRVIGANAISGSPLGISHLIADISKWRFKPLVVAGGRRKGAANSLLSLL